MNPLKNLPESVLSSRSAAIISQAKAVLSDNAEQQQLVVVGKKTKTMPILKLNFADPSSQVSVTNHASHSSHSSHASHHSRHR